MHILLYSLPVSGIGLKVAGFIIGPTSLLLVYYIVSNILLGKKINKYAAFLYVFMIFVFLISAAGRHPIASYAPSLLVLALFAVYPLFCSFNNTLNINSLSINLKKVVNILFVVCLVEFLINIVFPTLWKSFTDLILLNGSTNVYFSVQRIRAFTSEPSVLSKVLSFYFLLVLFLERKNNKVSYTLTKLKIVLMVGLTMSTAGIFILIVLQSTSSLIKFFQVIFRLKLKKDFRHFFTFLFYVVLASLGIYYFGGYFAKMLERLFAIYDVLLTGYLSGSVGFRVGSLLVIPNYLNEANTLQILLGEGYSNFSNWLILEYGYLENSGLGNGLPGNLITALILGTGVVGFSTFIFYILYPYSMEEPSFFVLSSLFIMTFLLSSGDLSSAMMWVMVAWIKQAFILSKTHENKGRPIGKNNY